MSAVAGRPGPGPRYGIDSVTVCVTAFIGASQDLAFRKSGLSAGGRLAEELPTSVNRDLAGDKAAADNQLVYRGWTWSGRQQGRLEKGRRLRVPIIPQPFSLPLSCLVRRRP